MSARMLGLAVLTLALVGPSIALAQVAGTVRVVRAAAVLEQAHGTANAVGTVNPGEVLEVLDERDGWYLVRPPAGSAQSWRTGWVNGTGVEPLDGARRPSGGTAPQVAPQPPAGRKGFVIGLGGGAGLHSTPVFPGFANSSTTSDVAVITDFRIGYAPTDQVLIYYRNNVGWTQSTTYDVVGVSGVGATYFFTHSSPGPFVSGAIGAAIGTEVDFGSGTFDDTERGTGLSIGGGWEFARHWSVEGHAMFLRLGRNNNHRVLAGTINWMFY